MCFVLPQGAKAQIDKKVGGVEQIRVIPPIYIPDSFTAPKDLDPDLLPSTCFYVQPSFQVGTLMAVGAAVGGYISNFNVEAFYMLGLAKSEDIYWTKGSDQKTCSYKPTAFGLRVGYGFTVADAWRLTPQAGLSAIGIKCSDGDSRSYAASATLGVRAEYAVAPHVQLFAAPEVGFAVSKKNIFKQLEDVSSKIKGWGTGFNARLGVSVTF